MNGFSHIDTPLIVKFFYLLQIILLIYICINNITYCNATKFIVGSITKPYRSTLGTVAENFGYPRSIKGMIVYISLRTKEETQSPPTLSGGIQRIARFNLLLSSENREEEFRGLLI